MKTVKVKCERLHRNEKRESKALWIGRLERSPVVCARWCSLIIHCMRWLSLSPHTQLGSILLSASVHLGVQTSLCACTCACTRAGGGYDIGL